MALWQCRVRLRRMALVRQLSCLDIPLLPTALWVLDMRSLGERQQRESSCNLLPGQVCDFDMRQLEDIVGGASRVQASA